MNDVTEILTGVTTVADPDTAGGLVTEESLPMAEANRLAAALKADGHEASVAPDQDDRSRGWLYVRASQ